MTVPENVEYGLRVRRVAAGGAPRRAADAALDMVRLERPRRPQAGPAVGRAAAAGRAGARHRQRARGAAARRAARRARPQAAPGDADRAEADPARGRHHLRLRHARPGGGAHHERPRRRVQPGADRADRYPRRGLRAARHRVRRRLHRRLQPARARRAPRHGPAGEDPAARGRRVPAAGQSRRAGPHRRGRLPRHDDALRRHARRAAASSSRSGRTWTATPPTWLGDRGATVPVAWPDQQSVEITREQEERHEQMDAGRSAAGGGIRGGADRRMRILGRAGQQLARGAAGRRRA